MAQRRMFSKQITDTDAFLDMPATAQNLYFHLNMHADDDGFLGNAKTIKRMVGASDDDLKILTAKQFILVFDDGVSVIRDWHIHNYIQKDRYHPTVYQEDKEKLQLTKNKQYQISSNQHKKIENAEVKQLDTECIQDVPQMDTEVRLDKSKVRLGKARLGKSKLPERDKPTDPFDLDPDQKNKKINELIKLFTDYADVAVDPKQYKNIKSKLMELPADEAEHVVQHVIRYLPDDFSNPIGYLIKSINNRRSGM